MVKVRVVPAAADSKDQVQRVIGNKWHGAPLNWGCYSSVTWLPSSLGCYPSSGPGDPLAAAQSEINGSTEQGNDYDQNRPSGPLPYR